MMGMLSELTNQVILACKSYIFRENQAQGSGSLLERDPIELIRNLELCLTLNKVYREQYRIIKGKLLALSNGQQFDFSENLIFRRFDLFCKRVVELIDCFSIIHEFQSLSQYKFHGDVFVDIFRMITNGFRNKRHNLLDFDHNRFDRDYVGFNFRISKLETGLQQFIIQSFEFPITHMYKISDNYVPNAMVKDEQRKLPPEYLRSRLRSNWDKSLADKRPELFGAESASHKRIFIYIGNNSRKIYERDGPMVPGISPATGVKTLKILGEEFQIRERKQPIYYLDEDKCRKNERNFIDIRQQYDPQIMDIKTESELAYSGELYDLYLMVLETVKDWKGMSNIGKTLAEGKCRG